VSEAPSAPSRRIAILLVPEFSMMAFTAAIEPLRVANRLLGMKSYSWHITTLDGQAVRASNEVIVHPDLPLADLRETDMLLICAGMNTERYVDQNLISALRKFRAKGVALGGLCTGAVVLAMAGLLNGYRCTAHWENLAGFRENFPDLDITSAMYEVDRDRVTCSGGIAPLDLMIHLIALDAGRDLATNVADQMVHHWVREPHEQQRMSLLERTGVRHPKLLEVLALMEDNLEEPLSQDKIAAAVRISARQLERLFQSHLHKTPSRYYLDLRLARAQHLLLHSALPIVQIAIASGFGSSAHLAKSYRAAFGHTPSAERKS
jgi:transcriptional regulator GlxA family with amidase domain